MSAITHPLLPTSIRPSLRFRLRQQLNRLLEPHGLALVRPRPEQSPILQLMLALRHFRIELVLDVGANTGQFALDLLNEGYIGKIYSVEPLPDENYILRSTAQRHPNWTILEPVAAGTTECMVEISVAGNSYSSSILEMLDRHIAAAPDSAPIGKISVQQKPLDGLFRDVLDRPRAALLKIDAQGYEHQILQGAQQCLARTSLVLLEMSLQPLYKDQTLWLEMVNYMKERGFDLWSVMPEFCDPKTGQLLQLNGLFFRPSES